jgi:hypothetical protein
MPKPAQIGIGHDMRCLSVMQHYEIPTRLLDWTWQFLDCHLLRMLQ